MYHYPAVPGPPKGTISPEDIFLETQFSLANNTDPLAVPTFDVPASPRRTWGDSQILDVVIRHRTRSQKGWTPIATDDKIRVTKDRGKVFQLVVDSPAPFAKEGIVLNLEMNGQIVPVDPSSPACGLKLARVSSVTSRMEGMQTRYSAELSIKISALCDKLRVVASVATDSHHVLTGKTVEFMTHNNGKVPNSQKDAEEGPKKLQFVVPSPTSSVNGNPMMINPQIVKSPYPDVMIINNSNIEAPSGSCGTFRGDQRHTTKRSHGSSGPSNNNPTTPGNNSNNGGTVNGGGSGGNKRSKVNFEDGPNNMNILYNKLMEAAPESPPHPPVGDCSSPDYGVAMSVEEPPLSQMKKRKYTPTSPPHTQGQQHPAGGHHVATPMMSPYAQSNPYLSPVGYPPQPMPMPVHLYHNTPPMQQQQPQHHHHAYHASRPHRSSDNSDSDSNSDRHSSGGVPQHWDHQQQASFSPQSTPEEEYEMQEMAHGGGGGGGSGGASGQGSEEEEYTSSSNNNSNISLLHGKPSNAAQVINGDLSVRGAVRARAYMQYSDIRLKTDVEDIVDAIDLIAKLDGKRYRWKPDAFEAKKIGKGLPIGGAHDSDDSAATNSDNSDSDSDSDDDERSEDIESAGSETPLFSAKHALSNFGFSSNDDDLEEEVDHKKRGEKVIGLIAQEVQRVLPEVVTEDEDGYLAVAYAEIVPVLISAFNEHMSNYNFEQLALKRKFEKFEAQLAELTEEKEMTDKETLAELAQEMKELLPETKYSRLVKKLSRMRRKDKIIQRNCCVLLICMFCFVIGLSIALAIISPISFQNVYNIIDNATGNTNSNSNTNYVGDGTYARQFQITGLSASAITLLGTRTDTSAGFDYLQLTASTKIGNGAAPPFTLAVSHALVPPANRRREIQEEKVEMTIPSTTEEDKEEATRANSNDDAVLALNFTYSLVSVFQYVESNGSPGYQNGESMTNLLNFAASNWTTLDHSTEQAEGINVTLACFSTSANSVLNIQACASELLCNVDGDWLSPDGLHYLVNVTLPIISPNTHYGAVFAMGGATGKKTITYDPAGPSLVFSDAENPAVVGQVTWDGPGSRVVTSWKKGPNQMTFSFVDSGAWEPWAFDVKIKYMA